MIKAVIFDCFGVLVGKGFAYTYSLAGGDPQKDKPFIRDMLDQANLGLISEDNFDNAVADKLGISLQSWRKAIEQSELPDRQLLDYIKSLRPKYKTAIMSNTNSGVLSRKIGDDILEECFDEVIASADVGLVKPDPRIYELTANKLGVSAKECIFIDDRKEFIDTGKELGMKGILYSDFDQFKRELEGYLAADPEG